MVIAHFKHSEILQSFGKVFTNTENVVRIKLCKPVVVPNHKQSKVAIVQNVLSNYFCKRRSSHSKRDKSFPEHEESKTRPVPILHLLSHWTVIIAIEKKRLTKTSEWGAILAKGDKKKYQKNMNVICSELYQLVPRLVSNDEKKRPRLQRT